MSNGGGLPSPPGTHIASWYPKKLGVPVAMVNKVGRSYKSLPNKINGVFPGRSAILDSDGAALQSMDDKEGIGIANITLDPGRKMRPRFHHDRREHASNSTCDEVSCPGARPRRPRALLGAGAWLRLGSGFPDKWP